MKIDVFTHFVPPKYHAALKKKAFKTPYMVLPLDLTPAINDMGARLRIMDRYDEYVQVLTLAGPPLDAVLTPEDGAELAKLVNDEMAEIMMKYPDRIVGAVATLPMHNMEAALKEAERAIEDLGLRGFGGLEYWFSDKVAGVAEVTADLGGIDSFGIRGGVKIGF